MKKLLLVAVLVGCGAEDDGSDMTPQAIMCQEIDGLYRISYRRQSGTCGDLQETVINTATASIPNDCTFIPMTSVDKCDISWEAKCPMKDLGPNAQLLERVKIRVTANASSATGTLFVQVSGVSVDVDCSGIYTITYTRL